MLDLIFAGDQPETGATGQQWDLGVDTDELEKLLCLREEAGGHKNQSERDGGGGDLAAQLLEPAAQFRFIEIAGPVGRGRK